MPTVAVVVVDLVVVQMTTVMIPLTHPNYHTTHSQITDCHADCTGLFTLQAERDLEDHQDTLKEDLEEMGVDWSSDV